MQNPDSPPAQGKKLTRGAMANYLDQYVVGQDETKKTLSIVVCSHYRKLGKRPGAVEIAKSSILLITRRFARW